MTLIASHSRVAVGSQEHLEATFILVQHNKGTGPLWKVTDASGLHASMGQRNLFFTGIQTYQLERHPTPSR